MKEDEGYRPAKKYKLDNAQAIAYESDAVSDMQQYARERWQQRQHRFKKIQVPKE